jgi:hypothetical protein
MVATNLGRTLGRVHGHSAMQIPDAIEYMVAEHGAVSIKRLRKGSLQLSCNTGHGRSATPLYPGTRISGNAADSEPLVMGGLEFSTRNSTSPCSRFLGHLTWSNPTS